MQIHRRAFPQCLVLVALLAMAAALPALAEFDKRQSFSTDSLTVNNLIGEVRVSGHAGSGFEVLVQVRGSDASPDLIEVSTRDGASPELTVAFPIESERRYVYPALGAGSRTSFTFNREGGDSWLAQLIGAVGSRKITVRGSGSGLEVWADIEIKVPAGGTLSVNHGVGEINAVDVRGDLNLDTHTGTIEVARVEGDVFADTGAGHVNLSGVTGELLVDTGSGHVTVEECSGPKILVDTGSGDVTFRAVETPELLVDTGSGHVRALAIRADSALIDTGSGEVELRLDRMGEGRFEVDTGGGAAHVVLDTGSGSIRIVRAD
jgi:hypothetical protein